MLCNICKKHKATVHVTEIVNNEMTELHLCEACAKKKSFQMEQHFGLSDLLAGLSDFEPSLKKEKGQVTKCSNCGLTYDKFREIGRLGCSECYSAFKSSLEPLLKRIHRATKHSGAVPINQKKNRQKKEGKKENKGKDVKIKKETEVDKLKRQMQEAVENEAFEKAAEIRDKIKKIKKNKDKKKGKK